MAASIPRPALVLGAGGLIPFAAATLGAWTLDDPLLVARVIDAVVLYAAVILSFVGAVHWGLEMAEYGPKSKVGGWDRYGWAVTPSLIAWFATFLVAEGAIGVLIAGFVMAAFHDNWSSRAQLVPTWYGTLRKGLSIGVIGCLGAILLRLVT